jgi:hypothetical protein
VIPNYLIWCSVHEVVADGEVDMWEGLLQVHKTMCPSRFSSDCGEKDYVIFQRAYGVRPTP